jgi:hypothetical protein
MYMSPEVPQPQCPCSMMFVGIGHLSNLKVLCMIVNKFWTITYTVPCIICAGFCVCSSRVAFLAGSRDTCT